MAQTIEQIEQMCAFIEQEAKEKAAEIEAKTQQEQDKQLSLLSVEGRHAINDEYETKLKDLDVRKRIIKAQASQKQLVKKMNSREELLNTVHDESKAKLKAIASGAGYKDLMRRLIVQGLIKLLEDSVKIKCRKADLALVKGLTAAATAEYSKVMKEMSGRDMTCEVRIDENDFVSAESAGGVVLLGHNNKIGCDNTLDTRLALAFDDLKPVVRATLFPSLVAAN